MCYQNVKLLEDTYFFGVRSHLMFPNKSWTSGQEGRKPLSWFLYLFPAVELRVVSEYFHKMASTVLQKVIKLHSPPRNHINFAAWMSKCGILQPLNSRASISFLFFTCPPSPPIYSQFFFFYFDRLVTRSHFKGAAVAVLLVSDMVQRRTSKLSWSGRCFYSFWWPHRWTIVLNCTAEKWGKKNINANVLNKQCLVSEAK